MSDEWTAEDEEALQRSLEELRKIGAELGELLDANA
jgi:hypothetical protein